MQPFRDLGTAPPALPGPPKTRNVASWILRNRDHLDDEEKSKLAQIRDRCPDLDALAAHVTGFAKILTGLHGDQLDTWIARRRSRQPARPAVLRPGPQARHDAVVNGLTLPWSSGVAEGNANQIKMLKRQTYGRASFALLRKRVLLAT